jgi:uncharacterized damage-inducible protein DinB
MAGMDVTAALLDSWDRQARIVAKVAELVTESNKDVRPGTDSWPLFHHLAHLHRVRVFHMQELDPVRAASMPIALRNGWEDPVEDLDAIRQMLAESAVAVRELTATAIAEERMPCGDYENPILFLQHQIWHEGWHVGIIILGLRLAGEEPPEEWEDTQIWGEFRKF